MAVSLVRMRPSFWRGDKIKTNPAGKVFIMCMKMRKKLLFLDLDGTLLNDEKQITQGNREALDQALERGHGVIISTGRPLKSAMDQARKLDLDRPGCYVIAYNGAVIYDWGQKKQIFSRTLPFEAVYRTFEQANAMDLHVQTYDSWKVLVEPRCDDAAVRRYCSLIRIDFAVIEDVKKDLQEAPVKCLVINYEEKKGLQKIQEWIRGNLSDTVDCFFSCDQYLEVVPKGMNKGEAVKMLCRMMDVSIQDAVAVGDAANDLAMIRAAGVGVAMANATQEVKEIADYITRRDNNHDGIQEVVERFFGESVQ